MLGTKFQARNPTPIGLKQSVAQIMKKRLEKIILSLTCRLALNRITQPR
jgi:hypothetical protein